MDGASSLVTMLSPLSVNLGAEDARQSAKNRPVVPKTESSQNSQSEKSLLNSPSDQGQNSNAHIQYQSRDVQAAVSMHTALGSKQNNKVEEKERNSSHDDGKHFAKLSQKKVATFKEQCLNINSVDVDTINFAQTLSTKHEFSGIAKRYNSIKPKESLGKYLNLMT